MLKKSWKKFVSWFELKNTEPALTLGIPASDTERHSEMRNIELADLRLQKEHYEKNLKLMAITVFIGSLGIIVSIALGLVALTTKEEVKIELYGQETIQKTD